MANRSGRAPVNPMTGRPNEIADARGLEYADRVVQGEASDAARHSADPATDPETSWATVLGRLRAVVDSRWVSTVVLGALCFAVLGMENIIVLAAVFFIGYVLIERFLEVRRAITMGGTIWLAVLFMGGVATAQAPQLYVSIDYIFVFCGFLLALAVCAALFSARSAYAHGCARGREEADGAIARHMVDRLIEHPDNWDDLDSDYLEVESALNRVRERERLAAQALRDESSRKDDLVTYLAHDLKTPLASVVGYLSLLHEAPDLPEEQRVRFTGVALEKAHRLDSLIEEFFDITRFDFHDIVLTRGYVDLGLMLGQVAEEFYPQLSDQRKRAVVDVPEGLVALVDGDKMARVFNNVMKNTIAYSYDGTAIRIEAETTPAGVRIRFINQGDPIPEAKLRVIFEKFYRLDAARSTNRGGAGLGLAIAREIVAAHGGTIGCTSTPEFTTFTIDLPA